MVTHTRNWSSAFNPSKCTHTAVSSEHIHGAVGSHCPSAQGAIGVRCLAQGHFSHGIEGGEVLFIHSPHLQSLPDIRVEPATFGLQV